MKLNADKSDFLNVIKDVKNLYKLCKTKNERKERKEKYLICHYRKGGGDFVENSMGL